VFKVYKRVRERFRLMLASLANPRLAKFADLPSRNVSRNEEKFSQKRAGVAF